MEIFSFFIDILYLPDTQEKKSVGRKSVSKKAARMRLRCS